MNKGDLCYLCLNENAPFTTQIPGWTQFTHWFFDRDEKHIVFTILASWRFGDHKIRELPKDVLFVIISHVIPHAPAELLQRFKVLSFFRLRKSQCDNCTKIAVGQPQCCICVRNRKLSIHAYQDYTYKADGRTFIRVTKKCVACEQNPVYICFICESKRGVNNDYCEKCTLNSLINSSHFCFRSFGLMTSNTFNKVKILA